MSLTKMKRAFIAAYCEDPKLGQAEAARSAGCSVKRAKVTAYEWMRDPEVKLEIQRQLTTKLDRVEGQIANREVTRESVFRLLDEVEELCKAAGASAWSTAGLLKVAEFRGKALKMWVERVEFGADDKLIALLEAGRKRAAGIATPELSEAQPPAIKGDVVTATTPVSAPVRSKRQSQRSRAAKPSRRKKSRACKT
jgi:phage terminase small subunit